MNAISVSERITALMPFSFLPFETGPATKKLDAAYTRRLGRSPYRFFSTGEEAVREPVSFPLAFLSRSLFCGLFAQCASES